MGSFGICCSKQTAHPGAAASSRSVRGNSSHRTPQGSQQSEGITTASPAALPPLEGKGSWLIHLQASVESRSSPQTPSPQFPQHLLLLLGLREMVCGYIVYQDER